MAEIDFQSIEKKWQEFWKNEKTFQVQKDKSKPKYYALDMFPYPSGAGLHVGHPLGYIATDIVSRYKRNKGFNVLHPMGFDAFGLPAEQYAIQTGQHPAITTEENLRRYKTQLNNIGFGYDWEREVRTSDPAYYKWTQWIFMQLFESWYDFKTDKAQPISDLVAILEKEGNANLEAACDNDTPQISAAEWNALSEADQSEFLLKYRLTYSAEALVNWCPELGTVLANDEVKDGFSERGGYPVERRKMRQWMMRITAYAERLRTNLDKLDWTDSMKDIQRNWIGKSVGCELTFKMASGENTLTAFTTRPDTIYGVTFMVLAPEFENLNDLCSEEQWPSVETYIQSAMNRSERERQADAKNVSGVFTGAYAINPFNGEEIPIWVADYVLAGYGTGVVMAVPSSDDRDFRFAKHFDLPIKLVIEGSEGLEDPTEIKRGKMINSGMLDGLDTQAAIDKAISYAVENGFGLAKVNYKFRDAVFSRQRYWGEPLPVYFKNGIPQLVDEKDLPIELPNVDEYKPTATGEPPLGRAKDWKYKGDYDYELTTMPGWAGSSWYFLRYMDPKNEKAFVSKEASEYWGQVDLYVGGTEHATGHLLYSRFWNMFLYDRGFISHEEPFKKLVNQGMIQGRSNIIYKKKDSNTFVSNGLLNEQDYIGIHVDVNIVDNDTLDIEKFKSWMPDYKEADFECEKNGTFKTGYAVEKMSKRWFNVVNPDDVIEKYGADTLRMYEMFLGPLEDSKPWDTKGIDGVFKFIRKTWRLFFDENGNALIEDAQPSDEAMKILHKTIKKVQEDIENFSFNTAVPAFMIAVNEFTKLNIHKRAILEPFCIILSPFAPHLCEELWSVLGHQSSVVDAEWPAFDESYLKEDKFEYPVMINGKLRTKISFDLSTNQSEMLKTVLNNDIVQKWTEGNVPKKSIIVPGKIINLVI